MAAIVTGFLRLLQPAMAVISQHQGTALWYGLLGIRLVALFIADGPWGTIKEDFTCNETVSTFCLATCFNQQFNFPFSGLWSFTFVASLVPVVLLKTSNVWTTRYLRDSDVEMVNCDGAQDIKDGSPDGPCVGRAPHKVSVLSKLLPNIICCLVLLLLEGVFLFLLASRQLPRIHSRNFICQTSACPVELQCTIFSQMDKLMAVITLIIISSFICGTCLMYLMNLVISCIKNI